MSLILLLDLMAATNDTVKIITDHDRMHVHDVYRLVHMQREV